MKTKPQLNSTRLNNTHQSTKQLKNHSKNESKSVRSIEEGEVITDLEGTLQTAKSIEDDSDCIVIENISEPIVIDEDDTIHEVQPSTSIQYFEDITGTPTLKFTPQTRQSPSMRRSCTAVLNSSDVIVLDETYGSANTSYTKNQTQNIDDSVLFVSESTPNFIPLVSDDVPKPLKIVPNPFSPKNKATKQLSNESFFTKSEKKELEKYNVNTYNPDQQKEAQRQNPKRMVIIDGSNVAFSYSRQREFSVKGLEICIEFFTKLGHEVKAVVPQMRLRQRNSSDAPKLDELYRDGLVILTPSKNIPGNLSSSYDDRFILQMASELDAAIVSNDNYRDLINENPAFKKLILNRVIGYTWVNDMFILPKDPYGRNGPALHEILNRKLKKP